MRTGKLPPELLGRLLRDLPKADASVRLGPRPGEDAAVLDFAGESLVVTTDPITFATADAAWYAVHVNANDIAACGAEPRWLAVTALLPPSTDEAQIEALFQQLGDACREVGVSLITGHTEITAAVVQPVIVGTMLGLAPAGAAITSRGAQAGDALLLAGPLGVEGVATLAREAAPALLRAGVAPAQIAAAAALLREPGISVLPAARSLLRLTRPHALHDATEGGLATALREVAAASGVGVQLDLAMAPALPLVGHVCRALDLDPLGLISSGCLIAAAPAAEAGRAAHGLCADGIMAAVAGRFTAEPALLLLDAGVARPLPEFERDELARFFERRQSDRGDQSDPPVISLDPG